MPMPQQADMCQWCSLLERALGMDENQVLGTFTLLSRDTILTKRKIRDIPFSNPAINGAQMLIVG